MFHANVLFVVFGNFIGCGGYLISTGTIVKPTYPPSDNSTAECLWYIESAESANSALITSASGGIVSFPIIVRWLLIFLRSSQRESKIKFLVTSKANHFYPCHDVFKVYDGWSEDGTLIYNGSSKTSIYSHGRKMLVKFPAWNSLEREREYSWNIHSVFTRNSVICSH